MQRTTNLRTVAAIVGATAIALTGGCSAGGTASDGPVEVSFWGWVPGIEDAVALWNDENPDVQVDFTRIASADATNLPSQIDAGTGPDVAQVEVNTLPSYVIDQQVQDLTDLVGDDADLFTETAWSGVTLGDAVWGVPQDTAPTALMYRADIFEQHGVEVPSTWDEYVAAAEALHAADPNLYIAQFSPNDMGLWLSAQLQSETSWFGTDGEAWTVDIDSPAALEVADRWQSLLDRDLIKVEQMWTPEFWADVNAGTIASINYAAWFPVIIEQNAPDLAGSWAVAPSPSDSGEGPYADLGGSANVVTAGAEHPDEAAEFITWLNSDPESLEILISQGGLFPAAEAGFDSESLNAPRPYWGDVNIATPFIAASSNTADASAAGPASSAAGAALADEFALVATGEQTMPEALVAAAATTRDAVESLGLDVVR